MRHAHGRRTLAFLAPIFMLLLVACGSSRPAATPPTGTPPVAGTASGAQPGQAPQPPAAGALLGAYVKPTGAADQAAQIRAFQQFETSIGHQLAIVHTYHTWQVPFPNDVDRWAASTGHLPLISWNGVDTRDIVAGRYDDLIKQRAQDVKALNHQVLLEWRWEMDRPDVASIVHSPADYIAAWDHIHKIFADSGATNIGWVWCPTAFGFAHDRAAQFYPGDDEVDWVCADAYAGKEYTPLSTVLGPFLAWAAGHPKPVLIGEFGAVEGAGDQRASWLQQLAQEAPKMPAVRAYVYFNANYEKNGVHSDISLDTKPSLAAFAALAGNTYFHPRALTPGVT